MNKIKLLPDNPDQFDYLHAIRAVASRQSNKEIFDLADAGMNTKEKIKYDNPDANWAQVELYRWQHGELPPGDETCKELDEPVAIRAMADAIELGCKSKDKEIMPSPYNVCVVLRYLSKKIR